MGVYIPNMKMPERCQACFANECQVCIFVDKNAAINGKLPDCPLIPVPPHGTLIDGDVLFDFILSIYKNAQGEARKAYRDVLDTIVAAADVIPAEEETE